MTSYLFYFHYWQLPDEPIEAVIDFDPSDMATKVVDEIHEEISYHTGVDPEPNSFMFVELFGLRPFNPKAWNMQLREFVGYYGNSFVVIDLTRQDLGDTSFFRPRQVAGGQRTKFETIGIENDEWQVRAQFEVRLVSSLIRWFQFHRKTKWLTTIPLEGQKLDYRVRQVKTEIPESNYSANWRIILPYNYPNEPPKLFISKKDQFIASNVDISHIWKDPDGSIFYFISDVNVDSTRWEETDFLVDFLLTGVWNFLVRSLYVTFKDLLFYKENVGNPYIIKEAPPQSSLKPLGGMLTEIADSDVYEDDIDYKVEIAELQEEIDYNEEVSQKSPSRRSTSDDFDENVDDYDDDEEDDSGPRFKRKTKHSFDDEDSNRYKNQGLGFDNESEDEEEEKFARRDEEEEEDDDDEGIGSKSKEPVEIRFKEWVSNASDEDVEQFGKLFTWLFLRVPDKALAELTLLFQADPHHQVFNAIDWRYAIEDISESKLRPFAKHIVEYYYDNTDKGLIYDTDRDFLRDTVLKKWKDIEKVPELRELLRKNVSQIKKVTYETLDFDE